MLQTVRRLPCTSAAHLLVSTWVVVALAGCGGDNPNEPSPNPGDQTPTVTAVDPRGGTTLGGTAITITGTNFAAGAIVTIGGTPATDVVVLSPVTLTARTPQHAAGQADVVVTVAGRSGTQRNGFLFEAPSASTNQPPIISGISSRSSRARAPNAFADLDDTLTLTATVTDPETPADQLRYEWSSDTGTFAGTGREVTWRAPAQAATPAEVRLNVTVIETYQTINAQGLPVPAEHRVPGLFTVRLHASAKEVRDLAVEFLTEFSQQRVSPDQMVRNFSDSCRGKAEERDQIRNNQETFTIQSYTVEPNPPVDVDFGGVCRDRGRAGDACAYVGVRWDSVYKSNGRREIATGTGQLNAIYEGNRWRLCDSDFLGSTTSGIRYRK